MGLIHRNALQSLRGLLLSLTSVVVLLYPVVALNFPAYSNRHYALIGLLSLFLGWKGVRELPKGMGVYYVFILLYVFTALLSLINNQDWSLAGWRLERYYPLLFLPLIAGLLVQVYASLRKYFFFSLSAASILGAFFCFRQRYFEGVYRFGFEDLNPNILGHLYVIVFVFLSLTFFVHKSRISRIIHVAGASGALYCIIGTGSVGAACSLILYILFLFIFLFFKHYRDLKRRLIFLSTIVLFAGVVWTYFEHNPYWSWRFDRMLMMVEEFFEGEYHVSSVGYRLSMYYGGFLIWAQNPFLGTGVGDVIGDMEKLIKSSAIPVLSKSPTALHSIYFDALAMTGVLGFVSMVLLFFLVPLRDVLSSRFDKNNPAAYFGWMLVGAVLVNFVFGLTNSWLMLRGLNFIIFTMTVVIMFFHCGTTRSFVDSQKSET